MALWAGIDEAGYGPLLGPLVVAGTAFHVPVTPQEGCLWSLLADAVSRRFATADGRLVVNDSKAVYTPARGLRALEEGVLGFRYSAGEPPTDAGGFLCAVLHPSADVTDGTPWSEKVQDITLPLESNVSALASKAAVLSEALRSSGVAFIGAQASVVLPSHFNRTVERTHNKANLLFQKVGLLLQSLWQRQRRFDACDDRGVPAPQEAFVLVDQHGGRRRYRKLLRDVFPDCACDVLREEAGGSVYRLSDREQTMWVAFKKDGDRLALPTSLASMLAKYVRELYMHAFNAYWQGRLEGLKPTAGYVRDARRFLRDIAPIIEQDGVDLLTLVRRR